jgi:pSer/pThr/pTyr-binding forkhead associated (FHA) protein
MAGASLESNPSSEATLEILPVEGRGSMRKIVLPFGLDVVVGRDESTALRIDDPGVSGEHARLVHNERGVIVTDLDSTNGTHVNGKRITQPLLLRDGDVISFASVTAIFRLPNPIHSDPHTQPLPPVQGYPPVAPVALAREMPIGASGPMGESGSVTPAVAGHKRHLMKRITGQSFRGTVLKVILPQVNVNPYLLLDIRTEDGDTVAVRAGFWLPFGVPHVAEGHRVRVVGRRTDAGFISPRYIENETTGVIWRRLIPWLF